MIQVSNPATVSYAYGYAAYADAPVVYAYVEQPVSVSDAGIVYRYSHDKDRWKRQDGKWAWSTQELANYYPRWHMARLNVGGQSQQLINSWGVGFDGLMDELARFKKELFIDTSELDQPDLFVYGPTVDYEGQPEKRRDRNFLRNPSFAIRGLARRNTPVWWSTGRAKTTGTVELVTVPTFIGSYSARLHAAAGERAYLMQSGQGILESGTSLTASLWYLSPIPAGQVADDASQAGIWLSILYADGSAELQRAPLKVGTDGKWRLASVTIGLTKEMYSFTFGVQIENDTANPIRIYAGAAQVEPNSTPTPWSEFPLTVIPFISEDVVIASPVDAYIDEGSVSVTESIVGGPVTYVGRKGRTLSFLNGYWELWYDATPSRASASLIVLEADIPDSEQRTQLGWYANPQLETFSTAWRIVNNKIEQYNYAIDNEIICRFDIGEMHLEEDFGTQVGIYSNDEDASFTRTIETLCVFRGRLWVLCKEVEAGVTKRVLKVLNPRSRWPVPTAYDQSMTDLHLECIGDVDIGVSSGSATYLAVVDENPDQLVMQIGDDFYLISLEYDFYYLDRVRAQVVARTAFDGTLVTL